MLFLIPPSETKSVGGQPAALGLANFRFAQLNEARELVFAESQNPSLLSQPTMPAIDRYIGTLYSAIHGRGLKGTPTAGNQLSDRERARAADSVLIQSAMYGLVSASDEIAAYKLSPSKNVNGLNLKRHWSRAHESIWSAIGEELIIDLRSKAYAELAPLPQTSNSYYVDVFYQAPDGSLAQMNHFNKKAKGQLVRAALTADSTPKTIDELIDCATAAGLSVTETKGRLTVITKQAT